MSLPDPAADIDDGEPIRFQLFVAGSSPRTQRAMENLRRLREGIGRRCEVEVIDVVADPARAEEERILATPTLVKHSPLPRRRITGDLSDPEKVLRLIGVEALGPGAQPPSSDRNA